MNLDYERLEKIYRSLSWIKPGVRLDIIKILSDEKMYSVSDILEILQDEYGHELVVHNEVSRILNKFFDIGAVSKYAQGGFRYYYINTKYLKGCKALIAIFEK